MEKTSTLKGHIAAFGANVLWGIMAPAAKIAMSSGRLAPLLLADMRMVGGAVLFWISSLFTPKEHVPLKDLALLAGAAMLSIVFNQGCYVFGVGFTSPGEASIITTTMPMWVMLLAAVILREPITGKKAGGIAIGATGALILIWGSVGNSRGSNPLLGDLLILTAQLNYALYLTLYKNFIKKYSLTTLMKWMFTFAAIATVPFSVPTIAATDFSSFSLTEIGCATYVVVMGTYMAYVCIMFAQKRLKPTTVGMYNYFQPVTATCIGLSLGLDTFTPLKAVAVVLIFSGVYMVSSAKGRVPS